MICVCVACAVEHGGFEAIVSGSCMASQCGIVAAVSTDIDGNGLCVHRACAAAERPTHGHTQHTPVGPDTEAAAPPRVCVVRVMRQLLESERCCQMQCSGSAFDAGRSGIASTDSDGS